MDILYFVGGTVFGFVAAWLLARGRERQAMQLLDSFKALSSDALKSNNQSFMELAKTTLEKYQEGAKHELEKRQTAIDALVKPLNESLTKVDRKIADLELARATAYTSLTEQIKTVATTQAQLQTETSNLVKALRAPQVRGRWGEIQLKRVVELAGMVAHCDFVEQSSVATENGMLRPDMIVKLPQKKNVIVDAKVPFQAYLEAIAALDDAARIGHLKSHARQLRDHVTKLSGKAYWSQFDTTPEFVVLFLPSETIFSAALEQDPSLIEYGAEHQVIIATPTTLIALLRAVAYGWRQEQVADNAREISDLGRELYDRLRIFGAYFADVRRGLERAVEGYNKAIGSFETRILVQARRFKDLGATTAEEIETAEPIDKTTRELSQ